MWRIVHIVLTHGTSVLVMDAHCAHTTPTPTDLTAYQIRGKSAKYNASNRGPVYTARSVRSHVGWRALQCSSSLSPVWQWGNDKFISYTSCICLLLLFRVSKRGIAIMYKFEKYHTGKIAQYCARHRLLWGRHVMHTNSTFLEYNLDMSM